MRGICDENITRHRIRKKILLSEKYKQVSTDMEIVDKLVDEKHETNNKRVSHPKAAGARKWTNQFYIISWCVDDKTQLLNAITSEKAQTIMRFKQDIVILLSDDDF